MKDLPALSDRSSRSRSLQILGSHCLLLGCLIISGCRSDPPASIPEEASPQPEESSQPLNPALPSEEDAVEAPRTQPQSPQSPSSLPGATPRPRDPAIVPSRRTPIPMPEPSGPAFTPFPSTLPERATPIPTPESTSTPGAF